MITTLSLLYLIKWYKKADIKNTVILALCTALTALTKFSGTIIAIPIMYIFIYKFLEDYLKNKDSKVLKQYLLKFAIFGLISLGLGLLYSVRNMILFNQSLFYVPTPGSSEYKTTFLDRIIIFTPEWKNIYCNPFKDSNIIAYLIKSSLFGEYNNYGKGFNLIPVMLLVSNIVIITISVISMGNLLINKNKKKSVPLKMFIVYYITQIVMYIYGNISMPFTCTMDFRYIVLTIFIGMLFIVENMNEKADEYCYYISCVIGIFALLSVIFELTTMSNLGL